MTKDLLRRPFGRKILSSEEQETILYYCETTINSRPLTYVEHISNCLKPLTPSVFLRGIPRNDVTGLDAVHASSFNRRLRYRQKFREIFRQRVRNKYMAMLVHQGQRKQETLHIGRY